MGYRRPSHRNPLDIQPEVCELCGKLIGHQRLIDADCDGLRGITLCDDHPMLGPSLQDYRAHGGILPTPDSSRREPIGAGFWYKDSGVIEREDGFFMLREDGTRIVREAA